MDSGALTSNAGTKITSNAATLTAPAGINVNTNINTLTASSTSGPININETDTITLADVEAANGNISITSGGAMTATKVIAGGTGTSIALTTTSGDILAGDIEAVGNTVRLTAAGAVTDNNGPANNVKAATLVIDAGTGIGSGNALETQVSNLAARVRTGNGNIGIDNTGDLSLTDAAGWGYAAQNFGTGAIAISAKSDLVVDASVISHGGEIDLSASGSIIQETGTDISSNGGNINLLSDMNDNTNSGITQNGSAEIVSNGGDITLMAGTSHGGSDILLTRVDAGTGSGSVITHNGSIADNNPGKGDVDILAAQLAELFAGGGAIGWRFNGITWQRDPIDVQIHNGRLFAFASLIAGNSQISIDVKGTISPSNTISLRDEWGVPPGLILFNDHIVGGGNVEDVFRAITPDLKIETHEFTLYSIMLLEPVTDAKISESLDQDDFSAQMKKKWWRFITR